MTLDEAVQLWHERAKASSAAKIAVTQCETAHDEHLAMDHYVECLEAESTALLAILGLYGMSSEEIDNAVLSKALDDPERFNRVFR